MEMTARAMDDLPVILYPLSQVPPKWDQLLKMVDQNKQFDLDLGNAWKGAILIFQKALGNGFFHTCGLNHPMITKLTGTGEGQIRELIDLAKVLDTLKESDSNAEVLIQKLKSKSKAASEGIPFLEIARTYLKEELNPNFLVEVPGQKNPDIEIVDPSTEERIFIEVSRINESDLQSIKDRQFKRLGNAVFQLGYDLPYSVKLHAILSDDQLEIAIEKIGLLKKEAWNNRTLATWRTEEISLAFAHNSCYDDLLSWCKQNSLEKGISGLRIEFNDTDRISQQSRIEREAKQIPSLSPGLIYFPIHFLYMMTMDKPGTTIVFQNDLIKFPNIYGLVLNAEAIHPLEKPILIDNGHIYSVNQTISGTFRYVFFIPNPNYKLEISDGFIRKVRKAIIN
jgi:hypothetical protein